MRAAAGLLAACLLGLLGLASPALAAFPGTNGKIAFQSSSGGGSRIWTMNADGGARGPISSGGTFDVAPAWSPDGARIAFTANRLGGDVGGFGVYLMGGDGSALTPVAVDKDHGVVGWSHDGTKLTFSSSRDGNPEIYTMNADGGGLARLTIDPREDEAPAWSPDGARIAFARDGEIWVMRPDGGSARRLGTGARPDWAPSGNAIAFQRDGDIWTMNGDGGALTQLTSTGEVDRAPAWSPDGGRIAFERDAEIYTMGANGGGVAQLTVTGSGVDINPDWQPVRAAAPPAPVAGASPGSAAPTTAPPSGAPPVAGTGTRPEPGMPQPSRARRAARVRSPIETLWASSRSSTQVIRIVARSVPARATVQVRCTGPGCPFARRTKKLRRRAARVALHGFFGRKRLRPGAVIEIRITRPGAVGKVNRYTVRGGRRLPREAHLCLSPGARRPAPRCR